MGILVALTAGIDGTAIVKLYQVSFSHCVMVRGAYCNNYLSTNEVKGEGIKLFLQDCLDGLHRQLSS